MKKERRKIKIIVNKEEFPASGFKYIVRIDEEKINTVLAVKFRLSAATLPELIISSLKQIDSLREGELVDFEITGKVFCKLMVYGKP